jgi:opacity protein-like surface antigen
MNMKKLMFFLVLLCVAVSSVQAQDVYQWFGTDPPRTGPPTTDWTQGYAWYCEIGPTQGTYGVVPDAYAKVKLNNVLWGDTWEQWSPVVGGENGPQAISIGDVFMVDAGWLTPEYLTVGADGSLLVQGATDAPGDGQINICHALGGTAKLIMDGGSCYVDGPVHVGWGGTGQLILDGGVLDIAAIDIGGGGGAGSIAITGGMLKIRDLVVDQMQQYVDDGLMTGYGSADNVRIDFDGEYTIVTAVPEPITLSLLSLGALLLRKRS